MCSGAGGVGGGGGAGSAGGAGASSGASSAGETSGASGTGASCAAGDASACAACDGVSDDAAACEAAGLAASMDSFSRSTTEEAGICVGTEQECNAARSAQTDQQAIEALDGKFLHDPRTLSQEEVRGLEALSRAPHLSPSTRGKIDSFLQDHYNGVDSLGINGQLGRPDAPTTFGPTRI